MSSANRFIAFALYVKTGMPYTRVDNPDKSHGSVAFFDSVEKAKEQYDRCFGTLKDVELVMFEQIDHNYTPPVKEEPKLISLTMTSDQLNTLIDPLRERVEEGSGDTDEIIALGKLLEIQEQVEEE